MSREFLLKFVLNRMKKSRGTLVPYLTAGAFTVMVYYIIITLGHCPYIYDAGKEAFYGAKTIGLMLQIAGLIVGAFACIFIFYANQFVIKAGKKEMALYGVLGMSRKNILYIMLLESLINALICIFSGILTGMFLSKIMLLVLYKIIGQKPVAGMIFSGSGLVRTVVLFAFIFGICLLYNVCSIRVGNPIELLHSEKIGEKEPKVKMLSFLTGVVTLLWGYGIALSTESTMDAMSNIFISIILLITATYCLFTAGSIFLLKMLKNNKKFYFKTKNFISISNLMFRMKHNAVGLASICILSTGVIILLTCGFSLMMLGEKNIDNRYPTEIYLKTRTADSDREREYSDMVKEAAASSDMEISNFVYRQFKNTVAKKDGNAFTGLEDMDFTDMADYIDLYFVTLDDYNHYGRTDISLAKDEVLVYQSSKGIGSQTLELFGNSYQVAGEADYKTLYYIIDPTMSLFDRVIVVLQNEKEMDNILKNDSYWLSSRDDQIYIGFDTKDKVSEQKVAAFKAAIEKTGMDFEIEFKEEARMFFYNIYGGAFFVGIFLAVLFLMATVLIIYYKQMSEGLEDQKRFEILANAGLTDREAKSTIKRQVMILFFLPVVAAVLHTVVAGKIIRVFLQMVLIVDPFIFALSTAIVCMAFFAVYVMVYKITSGQYYKIVYGKGR